MNILQNLQSKPSWDLTLPLCPVYYSRSTGERDIDLRSLMRKEKSLTLDFSESGFKEIGVSWLDGEIPNEWAHLTQPKPRLEGCSPLEFAHDLIDRIKIYLNRTWDPNKFHLVLMSGGKDSRLIGYILSYLRRKKGDDWIGRIHFRCAEPESDLFKLAIKRQGWRDGEWSVYQEGYFKEPNYYLNLYEPNDNPNGYYISDADFYHDIIENNGLKRDDIQLIEGTCATEILDYPARKGLHSLSNPFGYFKKWISSLRMKFSRDAINFSEVLRPYASYWFLSLALRMPVEFHRKLENVDQTFMMVEMNKQFGDEGPFYRGHRYNFMVSTEKRMRLSDFWKKYEFVKRFGDNEKVRSVNPMTMQWRTEENKIYNLGLTYEGL